ncbi:ABC transporter, partial [Salmonella enterica subsp. enterica serovar Typhimurium]|uniref:ABC transporter permease n=1 Tax=Salmonella enterica TaxID=28901 RepID=UPI000CBD1BC5
MAGILAITSLTSTLGAFGILVNDRARKIDKDFLATPISNVKRVAGYLFGTFTVGFVMTLFTYFIAQGYLYYQHGDLFTLVEFGAIIGIAILSVLSSTAMMFLLVELFTSPMAFETAMTVISSLVGFLAGIYIPMGNLPEAVRYFGILFPVTHGA